MPTELLLGFAVAGTFVLYSLFGGADFGGGVWDLLASGPRKASGRTPQALGNGDWSAYARQRPARDAGAGLRFHVA